MAGRVVGLEPQELAKDFPSFAETFFFFSNFFLFLFPFLSIIIFNFNFILTIDVVAISLLHQYITILKI